MTTVAVKDNVVAYDSRIVVGDQVVSDNYEKCTTIGGLRIVATGMIHMHGIISELYLNYDPYKKVLPPDNFLAIVVEDNGQICCFGGDSEDGCWKLSLAPFEYYAIGSGERYARSAMVLGHNAEEAVDLAIKLDIHTGGIIRSFLVD